MVMKALYKKKITKNEIINTFRSLKEYIKIQDDTEENLLTVIQQLAEAIANSEYSYINPKEHNSYNNYLLKKQIRKNEENALYALMMYRGTLS